MTKEEKILKEGLEKVSEKKDNMDGISSLAFFNSIGCSPFWAKIKFALSLAYYRITAFLIPISKSARLQSLTHSSNNSISHSLINSGKKRPLIAHIEAGLRSFDRTMPEEINRLLTDAISDYLFTTEESANENLRQEGIPENKIFFVGNTMIDTLLKHREKARQSNILGKLGLINSQLKTHHSNIIPYGVLTLHRPSNVDEKEVFQNILVALTEVSRKIPIVFPAHPRTINRIKEFHFEGYFNFVAQSSKLKTQNSHINCMEPLGYLDFLCLMSNAKLMLTDSGGIQEETTILGIPCITLRENTERPITATHGTNVIVGTDTKKIIDESVNALNGNR